MHRAALLASVALVLVGFSAPAVAEEQWVLVSDSGGTLTSYEITSRRQSGGEVLAWTHDEYKEPESDAGGVVWGQSMLKAYNCTDRTVRSVQTTAYAAPRRARATQTSSHDGRPSRHVTPGTVGARTFEVACDPDVTLEAANASGVRDAPFFWDR